MTNRFGLWLVLGLVVTGLSCGGKGKDEASGQASTSSSTESAAASTGTEAGSVAFFVFSESQGGEEVGLVRTGILEEMRSIGEPKLKQDAFEKAATSLGLKENGQVDNAKVLEAAKNAGVDIVGICSLGYLGEKYLMVMQTFDVKSGETQNAANAATSSKEGLTKAGTRIVARVFNVQVPDDAYNSADQAKRDKALQESRNRGFFDVPSVCKDKASRITMAFHSVGVVKDEGLRNRALLAFVQVADDVLSNFQPGQISEIALLVNIGADSEIVLAKVEMVQKASRFLITAEEFSKSLVTLKTSCE